MTDLAFPLVVKTKEGFAFPLQDAAAEGTAISHETAAEYALPDLFIGEVGEYESATPIEGSRDPLRTFVVGAKPLPGLHRTFVSTAEETLDWLEAVRSALDLKVDLVAKITGTSTRRYQEWRRGDHVPPGRLAQLATATSFLSRLQRTDPLAAKSLFERDPSASELIAQGKYIEALKRFDAVRDELGAAFEPDRYFDLTFDAETTASLVKTFNDGAVQSLLRWIEQILPETRAASQAWRAVVLAEVESAVDRYLEENTVSDEWEFLARFTTEEAEAFRREATKRLWNPHFGHEDWKAWLREQGDAAFADMAPLDLPPRTPVVDPDPAENSIFDTMDFDLTPPWKREG